MIIDYKFFLRPSLYAVEKNTTNKDKVITFFVTYLIMYFFILTTGILVVMIDLFVKKYYHFSIQSEVVKQRFENVLGSNFLKNIIFALIFGPIIEEVFFRLPLNLKSRNFFMSIGIQLFIFIIDKLFNLNVFDGIYWAISVGVTFFLFSFFCLKAKYPSAIHDKYYIFCFYGTAIFFGLVHVLNFYKGVPNNLLIFMPFFVLPQIFFGIFAGYIRLKIGIFWSIGMHILFNLPGTLFYIMKTYPNLF